MTTTRAHTPAVAAPRFQQRSFTSFDGTPIGYQVLGNPDGYPMLLANGLGGTYTAYRFVIDRFFDDFCFYCWDYRGLYTSGRPVSGYDAIGVEDNARDGVHLVKRVLGLDSCIGLGWSKGVQVLLEMTRSDPALFDGIVLHNGTAGRPYQTLAGTDKLERFAPRALRALQKIDGTITKAVKLAVEQPRFIDVMLRLGMVHHGLDRGVFRDMAGNFRHLDIHLYLEALLRLGEHDAWDLLPTLRVPTMLIASTHDQMTPLRVMQQMAERIPDARLEVLPGGTHYAAVEMPELVNRALERFFIDRFPELGIERT